MPSALETAIARHRAALLAGDARALGAMRSAYAPVRARLVAQIDELLAEIAAKGLTETSAVLKLERAVSLLEQVEGELAKLAAPTNAFLTAAQRQAVDLAMAQARTLIGLQDARFIGAFNRVPTGAMTELIGRLKDGSPLNRYLADLAPATRTAIEDALTEGLALGTHPSVIAADLAAKVDVAGAKLLSVTRTEMLSAYRGASLKAYAANADILESWIWLSALDNSCAACTALHGKEFPLAVEFFAGHVRCRCSPIPHVKGVDLGIQPGADWFAEQPAAYQDRVLRGGGGQKYRDGSVRLDDFVVKTEDDRWGDSYGQGSLKQAQANAARRERRAA